VDRLILTNAARHAGATVEALHQREQRPPTRGERFSGLLQRILDRSAATGVGGDPYFGPGAMAFLTQEFEEIPQQTITRGHELEDEKYIQAMRNVMNQLAEGGNVVIVGRGGSIILRDTPKVLRVGAVARHEDRVSGIMERDRIGRGQAEKTLVDRDLARGYYFKRYFDIDDPDNPDLYHMVINTSDIELDYAVDMVADACAALEKGTMEHKS
jgi:cytidylate kinase